MSSTVIIIAGVAIIAYTIGSQLMGTAIRAKRLIILPGIIAVVGVANLASASVHPTGTDIALIAIGSAVAAMTGLSLGALMRLESRGGWLWGQLPKRGLWLWVAFFASRGILMGIAHAAGAHVAGETHAELLILGINRLGQALVIGARAMASGIPFAPESDGSRPFGGLFGAPSDGATAPEPSREPPETASPYSPGSQQPSAPPAPVTPQTGRRLVDQLRGAAGSGSLASSPRSRRKARRAGRRGR